MTINEAPRVIDLAHESAFALGGYDVRPATRELVVKGNASVLEPRVMQVLVALSRRRGQVVSRDDLTLTCWGGRAVGEDALNRCIHAIRNLSNAYGGFKVVTIARVGYRLVEDSPSPIIAERPQHRKVSVCVLPFVNMSEDLEQEYFSDGISEDIITDLCKVAALSIVPRSTAFQFKGNQVDLTQIMRDLAVSHVLQGSVRRSGKRVRISAQLIAIGGHVWAERWDRDLTDIFALQDEISEAVVAALKLRLLPEEKEAIERRGTFSIDAYELYLMARQYRASGNEGDPRREKEIIRLSRRATEIDPGYARAWAILAVSQSALHVGYHGSTDDGLAAAEKALALDPNLPEAHTVKARHLAGQGKLDEAFKEVAKALSLDPRCWEANRQAALLNFRNDRFDDAGRYYKIAADLMGTDFFSPMMLITCCRAQGDQDGVLSAARMTHARAELAIARDKSNGAAMAMGCIALAALGRAEEAGDWARRALLIDPHNMVMRYNLACAMAAHLRDTEGAIKLLSEFFAVKKPFWMSHAKIDPDLEAVRDDPRFASIIADAEARAAAAAKR